MCSLWNVPLSARSFAKFVSSSGVVATLTTPAISIVSGGLVTIVGIGVLRWFAPGFWRYDARHPTP